MRRIEKESGSGISRKANWELADLFICISAASSRDNFTIYSRAEGNKTVAQTKKIYSKKKKKIWAAAETI